LHLLNLKEKKKRLLFFCFVSEVDKTLEN